jgi:hypothetical protein
LKNFFSEPTLSPQPRKWLYIYMKWLFLWAGPLPLVYCRTICCSTKLECALRTCWVMLFSVLKYHVCIMHWKLLCVQKKSGFVVTEFQYGTFAYGRTIRGIVKEMKRGVFSTWLCRWVHV